MIVAEGSLQRLASLARAARSATTALLRTLRGVGYQLAAEVQVEGGERGAAATPPRDRRPGGSPPPSSQEIRYCRTVDGANVAWASLGRGPALVRALGWFSNLEYEWAWPRARRFWELLGEGRRLIRYDGRGMGLSDPCSKFSPELRLRDLEAVVAASGEQRFDLVGPVRGLRHRDRASRCAIPSRVRRLVLYGPPAFLFLESTPELAKPRPRDARADEGRLGRRRLEPLRPHARRALRRPVGRRRDARALRPHAARLHRSRHGARLSRTRWRPTRRDEARKLAVPTLVVHRRDDAIAPFEAAKAAASLIPGARFVPLAGDNHWPMADDLSAPVMIRSIRSSSTSRR